MTWLWSQSGGRENYTAEHVNIWAAMVRRNVSVPHRVACVTDMPKGIDPAVEIIAPPRDFEAVRISSWGPAQPQCLRRLAMFRPDAAGIFGERFVSMDLDVVIGGSLDPLLSSGDDFVMYRGTGKDRPYNGSMIMLAAGARSQVYTKFTQEGAEAAGQRYVGSDQAWISHILGRGEKTFGPEHGVVWWGNRLAEPDHRVMFFPGYPKPWHVPLADPVGPWIRENYRR
ncbi:hypothetical protein SPHV1_290015 [Novosphingobium sp. KN65.2]|nr:hypothetical protein SPHV1_290015 [Novosphingobium sp. KN65.2]